MLHLHITAWVVAFILFFVTASMYTNGKNGKVTHMILRLFYLIIIFSGAMLFFSYSNISGELIVKVIAGLWAVIAMEMVSVRASKGKPTKGAWIQFFIAALIAIVLGFGRLPLGVQLFS